MMMMIKNYEIMLDNVTAGNCVNGNYAQIDKLHNYYDKFEVLTAVTMKNTIFCDVAPCNSVET
jgi:hypothetical protein